MLCTLILIHAGRNHGQKPSGKEVIDIDMCTHENSAYTVIKLKDADREEVVRYRASYVYDQS